MRVCVFCIFSSNLFFRCIIVRVYPTDSYEELAAFIRTVSENGNVKHFIIHARKALLNGYVS